VNGVTLIIIISVQNAGEIVIAWEYYLLNTRFHSILTLIPNVTNGGKFGLSIPSKPSHST
jgi:hypothetical protein